jgi:NDP-sugar pyrophosphorylase family protein
MAGLGKRFLAVGEKTPKFLLDVNGKPMISRVVESLDIEANYIFVVQKSHYEEYSLQSLLSSIVANPKIIITDKSPIGAATTTLEAEHLINNQTPLIIVNSDQVVEWNSSEFVELTKHGHCIALFEGNDPGWSYVKIQGGIIKQVAEKDVISNNATVGIYGWKTGADYVRYANQMVLKDIRTNGEFYVCPVYNEAIEAQDQVFPYFVNSMHSLGTPEQLSDYLKLTGSHKNGTI